MNGQSIGKRARKIKVARMDGGRPSLGQYVMRWVLRPIDSISYLGALVILINGRGQRLGDLAAGTCVVSMRKRTSLDDTLLVQVEQGHVPLYPEAVRLTDGQAQLIEKCCTRTGATIGPSSCCKRQRKYKRCSTCAPISGHRISCSGC